MSYPVFYVPAGDVLPIGFDSFAAAGESLALSGLAVTDIEVYKGTSMTQRASDAGYTLLDTDGIDLDGVTGVNGISIDTGDDTDAGFYSVGSWYRVVLASVTVDSKTVNKTIAMFRITAAENSAGVPDVHVVSMEDGVITAAKLAADAITAAKLAADVTTELQSGLATAAALSTVDGKVDTLLTRIPSALFAGITSLAQWLGLIAGKQTGNSTARTELRATGAGSGTFDETTDSQEALRDRGDAAWTTATGFSTHSAADVWASGTRTLTSISGLGIALATKLTKYVQLLARKDSAIATDNATELTEINANGGSGAGAFANSTESLEAIRDRGDAAWTGGGAGGTDWTADERTALRSILGIPASGTTPEDPSVGILDTIRDRAVAVEADTQDLQTQIGTAGAGLTALGDTRLANLNATVSSRATPAQVATELATYDGPTKAELDTAQAAVEAAIAALENLTAAEVLTQVNTALTTAVADSVPADGSRPSIAQAAYMQTQFLVERSVSGTTVTIRKPDGSTALFTLTLNDATTPTSVTRAS
jgi:hypothetical protein